MKSMNHDNVRVYSRFNRDSLQREEIRFSKNFVWKTRIVFSSSSRYVRARFSKNVR